MLTADRLSALLDSFGKARIAVVGDFFLDKYFDVDPNRVEISVETGRDAHQVVDVHNSPGAAGTVVNNLASLGAGQLHAIGAIGDDGNGWELSRALGELGCNTSRLSRLDNLRTPTYLKPRDRERPGLAGEHCRYDTKNRCRLSHQIQQAVDDQLESIWSEVDAVIVIDQIDESEGGLVASWLRESICRRAAQPDAPLVWVDSRFHVFDYRNVVTKCNQFEITGRTFPNPDEQVDQQQVRIGIEQLRKQTGKPVACTLGDAGAVMYDDVSTSIPAIRLKEPVDTTGAGDSFTAGAVLARCAGADWEQAALIGVLVSAITVVQLATTGSARADQLPAQLARWHKQTAKQR